MDGEPSRAVALPASKKSCSASCRGFRVKHHLFLFRFLLIDEIKEFKECLMAKTGVFLLMLAPAAGSVLEDSRGEHGRICINMELAEAKTSLEKWLSHSPNIRSGR